MSRPATTAESRWIRGGMALLGSGAERRLHRADIELRGRTIGSIAVDPPARAAHGEDVDAGGRIVVPGLVNAHLHSNDAFHRGRVEQMPLELYMLAAAPVDELAARLAPEDLRARTLLAGLEALRSGTTCVLDDCYHLDGIRDEGIDAVCSAYEELGIRAYVTANLADKPMLATLPGARAALGDPEYQRLLDGHDYDRAAALESCRRAIAARNRPGARVQVAMAASAPHRCSDAFLREIWSISESERVPCVTHALETRTQAATARELYGCGMLEHLHAIGCLTDRTVLAHGVWISDREIELVAAAGATIVHNPGSNLRLGSGVAPVVKLRSEGVNVALGTDGISTNDTQNLFLDMRLAASLHNVKGLPRRQWLTARDALDMATLGGARAIGRGAELGVIAEGRIADLVLLDARTTAWTPLGDPCANLVHAETGESVRTAIVDGEVVFDRGRACRVDEARVLEDAVAAAERFFAANADALARARALMPRVERLVEAVRAEHMGFERWLPGE